MQWAWFSASMRGRRRAGRRRRKAAAPLRVRRLERRRVLDAAVSSLVVSPMVIADGPEVSTADTSAEPLAFDWQQSEAADGSGEQNGLAGASQQANAAHALPEGATASDDFHSLGASAPVAGELAGGVNAAMNVEPVLIVSLDRTINEGEELDLSAMGGAPALGFYVDPDLADTHEATVNWGDLTPTEMAAVTPFAGSGTIGGTHTYGDDGTYTVTVSVMDNQGGDDTRSFTVTVLNVAPELTNIAGDTIDEGQVATVGATIVDPGSDDVFSVDVDWMDGTSDTISGLDPTLNSSGTVGDTTYTWDASTRRLELSHLYVDDGPGHGGNVSDHLYSVQLVVHDEMGSSDPYAADVLVNNVRPVLVVAAAQTADEGESLDLSGMGGAPALGFFLDVGVVDTHEATIDWGDGTLLDTATIDSGVLGGTHTYADNGTYVVVVTVKDDDGGVDQKSFQVMVNNVAPTVVVSGPTSVLEGSSYIWTLEPVADPGTDTLSQYVIHWGDGQSDTFTASEIDGMERMVEHTYADGLTTPTILVDLVDEDGTHTAAGMLDVTVNNVVPTLTLSGPPEVNEGSLYTLNLTSSDPGTDTITEWTINWGDSVQVVMGNPASVTHIYADGPANYTVTATATDEDGTFDAVNSVMVMVKNVAPTITDVDLSATMLDEGQSLTVEGAFTDPALGVITETFTVEIDWGNGHTSLATVDQMAGTYTATYTYADDHPLTATLQDTYQIIVTVTDDDGGSHTSASVPALEREVVVKNVAPTITGMDLSATMLHEGQSLTVSATFTDSALGVVSESFAAYIDWGDGHAELVSASGGMVLPTSHTYADDGLYTVSLRLADDDMAAYHTAGLFATGILNVDYAESTRTISVANVAPALTVTPTTPTAIKEGDSVSFDASFSDPGFDNPANPTTPPNGLPFAESFRYHVDWGDGRQTIATMDAVDADGMPTTGQFDHSHIYADDGTYTVTVRLADDNMGAYGDPMKFENGVAGIDYVEKTFTITVANVAPMLAGITNLQVDEGAAFTLNDLGVGFEDFGFDNAENPTVPMLGDPFAEKFAAHTIDWGDGRGPTLVTIDNINDRDSGSPGVTTKGTFTHDAFTYADDGVYMVTVRMADDNMGAYWDTTKFETGTAGVDYVDLTFTITVNNVRPTLAVPVVTPGSTTIAESESASFTISFSDPGFDNPANSPANLPTIGDPRNESFAYFIDWGDGRDQVGRMSVADMNGLAGMPSTGSFGAAHNYADDGTYTVTVRLADDNMSAFSTPGMFISGEADADYVEQTFTITVTNVSPSFVPVGGMEMQGDDINTAGITRIRVSFSDPGYDNPNNLNPTVPPAMGNPLAETFTYIVDWGDGTVDTIVVSTVSGSPVVINAQTSVISSLRTSGSASVLTTGSFEVQHRFLGPPNPLNPTADVVITLTLLDDNGGSATTSVAVSNPGIETTRVAIDTTPLIPRLEFIPPPPPEVLLDQAPASIQSLQNSDVRVASGDVTAASERRLILVVVSPEGEEVERHQIKDEALLDLTELFAALPEQRYRVYLEHMESNSLRLVIEVSVRRYFDPLRREWRGRIVDPADVSEGLRDRQPTSESAMPVDEALPLDQNPMLEQLLDDTEATGDSQARQGAPPEAAMEAADSPPPARGRRFVHWSAPLAAMAWTASSGNWSHRLESALREADERAWQRLRRMGRSRRSSGSEFQHGRRASEADCR